MGISRSRTYIAENPRFALTNASTRGLQRGQMTMVYKALAPYPAVRSLEELADRCQSQNYRDSFKRPISLSEEPLFLRMSILYHLKRMEERNIVKEL